jgi:hypothetical protein
LKKIKEVCFGSYDCQNESILQAISRQFSTLFVPVLNNLADSSWGKLSGREGQMAKVDFLSKLNTFVSTLNGAQESINERVNHAIFPLISIYDHYGLPMGFNRFQDYIISKMKNNSFSIFFVNIELDHYKKIMSAYGAVFFELGILGFTIPYYLYSIFRTVLKNKVYLFSFILLNLLLFTSISLNNSLILFVFGNVLYLKKQNFKTID